MPGKVRGVVRTAAVAGTAVSNRVSRRQAECWGQQDSHTDQEFAARKAKVLGS